MSDVGVAINAARQIERTHLTKRRGDKLYIACEEYDFTWSADDVKSFREMWRDGLSLINIAIALKRHVNEIAILVIDQAEVGYIKERPGGLFGTERECTVDGQSA